MTLSGVVNRVKEFSPDLIGITSTTPTFHVAVELARELGVTVIRFLTDKVINVYSHDWRVTNDAGK